MAETNRGRCVRLGCTLFLDVFFVISVGKSAAVLYMRLDRGSVGVLNSHLGHPHLFCGIIEGLGPNPTYGLCHYGKETPAIVVNKCLGKNLYLETVVNVRNYRIRINKVVEARRGEVS
jgi:hypothetical protein